MKIFINNTKKRYTDNVQIENMGSHYSFDRKNHKRSEIIINLKQILRHSKECCVPIEHTLIQHISHETIHKLLAENINIETSIAFDNIAANKARLVHLYGMHLEYWFAGFYEGVKQ
jgi:hypothetical protein